MVIYTVFCAGTPTGPDGLSLQPGWFQRRWKTGYGLFDMRDQGGEMFGFCLLFVFVQGLQFLTKVQQMLLQGEGGSVELIHVGLTVKASMPL